MGPTRNDKKLLYVEKMITYVSLELSINALIIVMGLVRVKVLEKLNAS